jgi:hypothetical protein
MHQYGGIRRRIKRWARKRRGDGTRFQKTAGRISKKAWKARRAGWKGGAASRSRRNGRISPKKAEKAGRREYPAARAGWKCGGENFYNGALTRVHRYELWIKAGKKPPWRDAGSHGGGAAEAGVKSFFGAAGCAWLIKFLEHDMAYGRIIEIARRFPDAGAVWDGGLLGAGKGVQQGDGAPPTLADACLRYALDLRLEAKAKRECKGEACLNVHCGDFA